MLTTVIMMTVTSVISFRCSITIICTALVLAYCTSSIESSESNESNRFTWKNHQEDHSLYSGRSLMLAESIGQVANDSVENENGALETVDYAEKEWQLMFRYLDLMFDGIGGSEMVQEITRQFDLYDSVVTKLEPKCARDIQHFRNSFKQHKMWALRMLDSYGKIPSGVTYGRFSSQGDFEECVRVKVDETVQRKVPSSRGYRDEHYKFYGKYCLMDFRLPLPERPRDKLLSIHEPVLNLSNTEIGKKYPEMTNYSGYASVFYEAGYMHAFCLPSSCRVEDFTQALGKVFEGIHIIVNNTVDCQELGPEPLRKSQVISLILLSLILINAGYASYVYAKKHHRVETNDNSDKPNPPNFYTDCFSIQTNFYRLSKPDPRGLTFVHYTRIVAMALTVITHTAALGTLQAITKPADASNSDNMFRDFIPQMLANAFSSIQIFFFMAGFMLVVSTYPSIAKAKGKLSLVEYAIKRAIRLLPGLFAAMMANFLWPLFVEGPMVTYFTRMIVEPCEINWWRTLTFLSNFDHVEKMCLRHSYFSASDYQLHLASYPLLLLLYKQPVIALYIAGLLTISGFAIQVIMILTKVVLPFMMVDYLDKEAFFNVVHYIHHPVWNHMSAFFYGFIIGYLVVKQIRINLSEKTIKYVWVTLMPLGILAIFAPYYWNHYKRPIHRWQMVLYIIIDRALVLSTCAWLAYGTMVLARKPRQKKESDKPSSNFTTVVTIGQETKAQTGDTEEGATKAIPLNGNNIQIVQLNSGESKHENQLDLINLDSQKTDTSKIEPEERPKRKRTETSVSNINTLCLILSRLTFQLYLFNMVVLWIDVQHSKYNWYFSYYFIIVKSFAIYIGSTILALTSYVILETPALTLYIAWIKRRSDLRAKAKNANEDREKSAPTFREADLCFKPNLANSISVSLDKSKMGQRSMPDFETLRVRGDVVDNDLRHSALSLNIMKDSQTTHSQDDQKNI